MTLAELVQAASQLPLSDPDRHDLETPEAEAAFAHLAIDHPDAVEASNETRRPEVATS